MDNTENTIHPSLIRRRPSLDKHQAAVMAARLFNLHVTDPSSVKELHGYDDRNFYMRGFLVGGPGCQEYVLKVVNNIESSHECLMQVQCNAMSFLKARGYNCSTPVQSIFKTHFVKCKIPRKYPPGTISLETHRVPMGTDKDSVALKTVGVPVETNNDITLWNIKTSRNIVDGIEVYDDEEYSEEEFFVCSVLLLNFVPGEILNEIPLNTHLLFNAGVAVGRMNRDLKVSENHDEQVIYNPEQKQTNKQTNKNKASF